MVILLLLGIVLLFIAFLSARAKAKKKNTRELNAEWLPIDRNDVSCKKQQEQEQKVYTNYKKQEDETQDEDIIRYLAGEDKALSLELEIDYKDSKGNETTRQIKLKRYRINPDNKEALLYGFCSLRNGGRDFYASRIQRCVDLETGEVIENIILYLEEKYEMSPGGKIEKLWNNQADEINILVYVGKADGMLRKPKKEIIASYVIQTNPDYQLTTDEIVVSMKNITALTKTQFARALGRLSSKEEQPKKELIDYAERIINTKKKRSTEEEAIIPYITKRLFPNDK